MSFLLPTDLDANSTQELERAFVTSGPDNVPSPCKVWHNADRLTLQRESDESGYFSIPWSTPESGLLRVSTCTLMERPQPYGLPLELARGKINQVRCQAYDWSAGGLELVSEVVDLVKKCYTYFGQALQEQSGTHSSEGAEKALASGLASAEALVRSYMKQVFEVRHSKNGSLPTLLGARLSVLPEGDALSALDSATNSICVRFPWRAIEEKENARDWGVVDQIVDWAEHTGKQITGGPILDFHDDFLPLWLSRPGMDITSAAKAMANFVAAVIRRYRTRIRRWFLATGSNLPSVHGWNDEEMLWLTVRMSQCVKQLDPEAELIIGVAEPWGECMAMGAQKRSPFEFSDSLIRSDLNLAGIALDIEIGSGIRGSYARDLLDCSRLLDLFALLGVPVIVSLGYPHGPPVAGSGWWRSVGSMSPQAEWAQLFGSLALCKPFVQGAYWLPAIGDNGTSRERCGLLDETGKALPSMAVWKALRTEHLF